MSGFVGMICLFFAGSNFVSKLVADVRRIDEGAFEIEREEGLRDVCDSSDGGMLF